MRIFKVLNEEDGYKEIKTTLDKVLDKIRTSSGKYKGIITFDTEVNGFGMLSMLHKFQICLDGKYALLGDTTDEFIDTINLIYDKLSGYEVKGKMQNSLIIFGHNIAYDYYILEPIFKKAGWVLDKVLGSATSAKAVTFENGVTIKCTYKYSEQSLMKVTKGCLHAKRKGDLDFNKFHHPCTKLDNKELIYCLNDVVGLYEFIQKEMKLCQYKDVYEFPMTKTSRVRLDFKNLLKTPYYSANITKKDRENLGGKNGYHTPCYELTDESDIKLINEKTREYIQTIVIKSNSNEYSDIEKIYNKFVEAEEIGKCNNTCIMWLHNYAYRLARYKDKKDGSIYYKLRVFTHKDNLDKRFSRYYKNYNLFNDKKVLDTLVTSYEMTQKANRGGLTHANLTSLGIIEDNVVSFDAVSHYPSLMATQKFGFLYKKENYTNISYKTVFKDKLKYDEMMKIDQVVDEKKDYIIKMKIVNFKSRYGLVYIPKNKIEKGSWETHSHSSLEWGSEYMSETDNGYLVEGKSVEYIGYLSDLNCVLMYYDVDDIIIEEIYSAKLEYLTDEERVHVCKMYSDKAYYKSYEKSLEESGKKGTPEWEECVFNKGKAKTMLNGEFGVDDTDYSKYLLADYYLYDNKEKVINKFKEKYADKVSYKLNGFDEKKLYSLTEHDLLELYVLDTFKWGSKITRSFIVGPQITAKGRYILAKLNIYLMANGVKVVYNDTDSTKIKYNEKAKKILDDYNKWFNNEFYKCKEELRTMCSNMYPNECEKFEWFDDDSLKMCHFENENIKINKDTGEEKLYVSEFYTLGAKRYMYSKRNFKTGEYYKVRDEYKEYLDIEIEPTEKECPNKYIRSLWKYRNEPYYDCKCAGISPLILTSYLYSLPHKDFKEFAYNFKKGLTIPAEISERTIDHRTDIVKDMQKDIEKGRKRIPTEYTYLYDYIKDDKGNLVEHRTNYTYKYKLINDEDNIYVVLYLKDRHGKVNKYIANNGINITKSDFRLTTVDDDVIKNIKNNRGGVL